MSIKKQQSGFTLIELVVVIVILGILAATAIPKFVDLSTDARKSVLTGIQGSASSGAAVAYAKAAVSNKNLSAASGESISIDGQTINLVYGFPAAADIDKLLQDKAGATFSAGTWTLRTNCTLTYAVPASAGANPTYTQTTSGC